VTTPPHSAVPQGEPSEEEDDHDLLTYGIAGDRLRGEIEAENQVLTDAVAAGDEAAARRSRFRIADLEAAFRRHVAARDGEFNEKQFFGEQFES
jgi:hypothetical protein